MTGAASRAGLVFGALLVAVIAGVLGYVGLEEERYNADESRWMDQAGTAWEKFRTGAWDDPYWQDGGMLWGFPSPPVAKYFMGIGMKAAGRSWQHSGEAPPPEVLHAGRLSSVAFGALGVAVFFLIARTVLPFGPALAAALLLASHPVWAPGHAPRDGGRARGRPGPVRPRSVRNRPCEDPGRLRARAVAPVLRGGRDTLRAGRRSQDERRRLRGRLRRGAPGRSAAQRSGTNPGGDTPRRRDGGGRAAARRLRGGRLRRHEPLPPRRSGGRLPQDHRGVGRRDRVAHGQPHGLLRRRLSSRSPLDPGSAHHLPDAGPPGRRAAAVAVRGRARGLDRGTSPRPARSGTSRDLGAARPLDRRRPVRRRSHHARLAGVGGALGGVAEHARSRPTAGNESCSGSAAGGGRRRARRR